MTRMKPIAASAIALIATAFASNVATADDFGSPFSPNPVVVDSGRQVTDVDYDPWSDQYNVRTHRDIIRESALDECRGHVDEGSLHYVRRYVRDCHGRLLLEQGWKWTSHGVPHGDLTRTKVSYRGGRRWHDDTHVIYSRPVVRHEDETHVQYSTSGGFGGAEPRVRQEDNTRVLYHRVGPQQ